MMRESHGISRARRLSATENNETQSVLVTDSYGEVVLQLSACAYPAGLSPAQADFVAEQLLLSAARVRKADAERAEEVEKVQKKAPK